jgi:phenylacetate-coenzyme A ligase PaaK-like adenylate-forming protein
VLATSLANRVQPIIRYDLGDSITVQPAPCPCGSRLPAIKVNGRRYDTIELRSPEGGLIALLPEAVLSSLSRAPGVEQYQVLQVGREAVRIRLQPAQGADPTLVWTDMVDRLRRFLDRQGLPNVRIERASEPPRRDERSGKFQKVQVLDADGPTSHLALDEQNVEHSVEQTLGRG